MFEQILLDRGMNYVPNGYRINGRISNALGSSNNHKIVVLALEELQEMQRSEIIQLDSFNRDDLRSIWASDECSFTTKYLATLWWGAVDYRISNRAFSVNNMIRLQEISLELEKALLSASKKNNIEDFLNDLSTIFFNLGAENGLYRLPYISVAFFTKILQFFFASHPVNAQPGFIPIIADKWLLKAVFCELTDNGHIELRDNLFTANARDIRIKERNWYRKANNYNNYINYFNNRSQELGTTSWYLEGCLFSNPTINVRYNQIINNNPIADINIRNRDLLTRTRRIDSHTEQPTNINYQPDYEALVKKNTGFRVFDNQERIKGNRKVFFGCELENGLRLYVGKNQKGIFCSIIGNNLTQEIKDSYRTLLPKGGKDWIAKYCDYDEAVSTFNQVLNRLISK